MRLKIAGTILVLSMLAVVLANQNAAGDKPSGSGEIASQDAALSASVSEEPISDPFDEIQRLRENLEKMKQHVETQLRKLQGLDSYHSNIAISGAENDGTRRRMSRDHLPRMSLEEEEWIVLAGQLNDVRFVDLLLNRIADSNVHLLDLTSHHQCPPAFYFLCNMGLTACQPALSRIPLESDDRIRDYLTQLLQRCLGNTEARSRLVALKDKCEAEEMRERVQTAIEQCDSKPLPHQMDCR